MGISRWRRTALSLCGALAIALAASGCSNSGKPDQPTGSSKTVAASVAPIADVVEKVAGGEVKVVALVPPGVDSHTFEPSPETARTLANADVAFFNGLGLEEPTIQMARKNMVSGSTTVMLGEETITPDAYVYDFSFPRSEGKPNPHLWMNPILTLKYAKIVSDTLSKRYPESASAFKANYDRFATQIAGLDQAIFAATSTIPMDQRKLLTYHDSFAYFAPRYGMTVIGAAELSNFQEPSAAEIAALIEQVRSSGVRAIFGSEVFPSRVLEQVARETGAQYIDKLSDDELPGEPGDKRHSYIGMMVENVETMTVALGGSGEALQSVPT
ncbi:MAG: zinc ABC transporter substrate-binding protein [Acidobacteria bacterium]|nr:MAG: zinc ABC transporter substrate-binding protein [Acidobacteriota bacterium]